MLHPVPPTEDTYVLGLDWRRGMLCHVTPYPWNWEEGNATPCPPSVGYFCFMARLEEGNVMSCHSLPRELGGMECYILLFPACYAKEFVIAAKLDVGMVYLLLGISLVS